MKLRLTHVLVVAAAASVCWLTVGERALRRDVARLQANVEILREELEEQRTLVRMNTAAATALTRQVLPAASAPAPVAVAEPSDQKAPVAPVEEDAELPRLESGFAGESYDPSWATDSEQHLTTSLVALAGEGQSFLNVSCRTSLCRAEIRLTDGARAADFVEKSSTGSFWSGLRASRSQESSSDHSVVVTMFFAKG